MHKIFSAFNFAIILLLTISTTSLAAWQVNLDISTPDPNSDTGIASNKLVIGTDPNATDGYDNQFDTIALLDGPVQAYISHPEYAAGQQKLWRDIRMDSLPQEWEIEVEAVDSKDISITWQIDTMENLQFTLTDMDTNKEIRLKSSTAYSYRNTSSLPKSLLLRVEEGSLNIKQTGKSGKGGGCGYIIKNAGKREGNSVNEYGQNTLNMLILITPLVLPMLFHRRRISLAFIKKKDHLNNIT